MRINLGCGARPLDGYVNVDGTYQDGVDVAHDLDIAPWPFDDHSAEHIEAFDVFEHVDHPLLFVAECHRVLAEGGTLRVHTSYWRSENSYTDPTHKRFCTERTFDYWIRGTQYFERYGKAYGGHDHPFELVSCDLEGNSELDFVLRAVR